MQHREWKEQEAIATYLHLALPDGTYWTAIDQGYVRSPNPKTGALSSEALGALRRKRGIKASVPDWQIIWQGIVVFVEQKTPKGSLSGGQKEMRDMLIANGVIWGVARSIKDMERILLDAGIPLRCTTT